MTTSAIGARRRAALGALVLSLGCYSGVETPAAADGDESGGGDDDDGSAQESGESGDDGTPACADEDEIAYTPMRRLSRREYEHSVLDLFGVAIDTSGLAADEGLTAFASNSTSPVATLGVEAYMAAAEGVAVQIDPLALAACDPEAIGVEPCAQSFVETLGRRVYRRPLAADELDELVSLVADKASEVDFAAGVRLAVEAMLQSPNFLYRPEAAPEPGQPAVPLNDFELATRLSYLLWASGPDDALLDAAAAGELASTDALVAHAERMLDDDRASRGIASFHQQWLAMGSFEKVQKDPGAFPEFTPELRDAMLAETLALVEAAVRDGDGSFGSLFTARTSFLNEPLAAIYGIDGVVGPELRLVELPPERGGILTTPGVLAVLSDEVRSLPPHAGKVLQANVLCTSLEPPDDADMTPPQVPPGTTTREAWEQRTSADYCAGCHALLNPIGFAFLSYDPIGRWRVEDGAGPIDPSGSLSGVGEFADAVELSARLAESPTAQSCYVKQWFRYGLGRLETVDESCSTGLTEDAFVAASGDIETLVRALITSAAFRQAGAAPLPM